MKKIFFLCFLFTATVVLMPSCRHSSDLPELPEIKFSTDVQSILVGNCTQGGCHGSGSDHRQFSLVSYDDVINSGTIDKGNAHNSKLFQAITGRNSIMPKAPQTPLTDLEISLIYVWINQGAKNN